MRSNEGGVPSITLEQAYAAAHRNGIDARMLGLEHDAQHFAGDYGSTKYDWKGQLLRSAEGRFRVRLTDLSLQSERQAVNTIAHEVNHIRESLRTGLMPANETAATRAGNLAEEHFVN
jgi:hypothetical protein